MSLDIHSRTGDPFNFVDGIKLKGIDISSINGATAIGTYVNPTDTTPKLLQTWITETVAAIESLKTLTGGSNNNATAVDKPITDSSQYIANTKFVQELLAQKLVELLGGATAPLNTVKALATAINNDANFYATLTTALGSKAGLLDVQTAASSYSVAGGTANAITGAFTPVISTVTDGMIVRLKATSPNTGAVTFSPNVGVVAYSPVQKGVGVDLAPGDIAGTGYPIILQRDNATNRWVMLNPAYGVSVRYASDAETVAGVLNNASVTPVGLKAVVSSLVGAAPALIDTITELAAAINNNPNFATTIAAQLALKAPLANPVFTGAARGTTQPTTDSSDFLATTAFVKAALAAATASGGVPNASTTVAGVSRYATPAETAAGVAADAVVTPAGLAPLLTLYVKKDSPTFTTPLSAPTPAAGDSSTLVATTEYVTRLYNTIPTATTTVAGLLRLATTTEALGSATNIAVTPGGLAAKIAALPAVPTATETVKGTAKLATSALALAGVDATTVLTPALGKAMVDLAVANVQPPPVFAPPLLTGAAASYQQKPYSLLMEATPVGNATSVASFTITIANNLTGSNAFSSTENVPAVANKLTKSISIAPRYSNSTLTITVVAIDNLGASSEVATKTVTSVVVVVTPPTVSSPTANQTGVSKTPTFAISGFGVSADTDTHRGSMWKILSEDGSTVLWSVAEDTVNKTTITIPTGYLNAETRYRLDCAFFATTYGSSATTSVYFTTAANTVGELQRIVYPGYNGYLDPGTLNWYGHATSMSADGTYLVVGAPYGDQSQAATTPGPGCAFVFIRSGSSWQLQATLTVDVIKTDGTNTRFGSAVAIDATGTRIAVGAPEATELYGSEGHVQIFLRTGTTWARETKIVPPVNENSTVMESYIDFGQALSFNAAGDVLAIGAPRGNGLVSPGLVEDDSGFVYMCRRSGTTWTIEKRLRAPNFLSNDNFGHSVCLDAAGVQLVATCQNRDYSSYVDVGSILIYNYAASDWTVAAELFPPDVVNVMNFGAGSYIGGSSIKISGDGNVVVAGARVSPGNGNGSGAALIFVKSGAVWNYVQKLDETAANSTYFGLSVAINNTGSKILVGSYAQASTGVANLYKKSGSAWTKTNTLAPSKNIAGEQYGRTVTMCNNGDYGAVSAINESATGASLGACYTVSL